MVIPRRHVSLIVFSEMNLVDDDDDDNDDDDHQADDILNHLVIYLSFDTKIEVGFFFCYLQLVAIIE